MKATTTMGFWEITKKDLKLLVRDRRTTALLVVLPLVFITIIGLTTGKLLGWRRSNQLLQIGFVDNVDYQSLQTIYDSEALDNAKRTRAKNVIRRIVNSLQEGQGVQMFAAKDRDMLIRWRAGQLTSADHEWLEKSVNVTIPDDLNAGFVFGSEFFTKMDQLKAGDILGDRDDGRLKDGLVGLDVEMIGDRRGSNTFTIIDRLVMGEVLRQVAPTVFCRDAYNFANRNGTCERLEAEGGQPPIDFLPPEEGPGGADNRLYDELVPGWTVMFVFFLVNIMARSFIHERDLGTLRRLRIAPVAPTGVMLGKTLPFFIVSIVQTLLLFLTGKLLFGMSWGVEPWLLIPIILSTSMAATTLGLMVATLVKTDSQVSAYANFVVIVMAGISGCFLPRDWLPDLMKTISLATPHAWALMGYREILTKEAPMHAEIFKYCGIMVLFSILYFAIGAWRFRDVE